MKRFGIQQGLHRIQKLGVGNTGIVNLRVKSAFERWKLHQNSFKQSAFSAQKINRIKANQLYILNSLFKTNRIGSCFLKWKIISSVDK